MAGKDQDIDIVFSTIIYYNLDNKDTKAKLSLALLWHVLSSILWSERSRSFELERTAINRPFLSQCFSINSDVNSYARRYQFVNPFFHDIAKILIISFAH